MGRGWNRGGPSDRPRNARHPVNAGRTTARWEGPPRRWPGRPTTKRPRVRSRPQRLIPAAALVVAVLGAAARHQPPRALRADRAAAGPAAVPEPAHPGWPLSGGGAENEAARPAHPPRPAANHRGVPACHFPELPWPKVWTWATGGTWVEHRRRSRGRDPPSRCTWVTAKYLCDGEPKRLRRGHGRRRRGRPGRP